MKPSKKAVPVPDIQVYARPRGNIQWACPDCGFLHSKNLSFWRRAQIACTECQHKFRIGLGFTDETNSARCVLMGRWSNNLANRVNPTGGDLGIGSVYGNIDWTCPNCEDTKTTYITRREGIIKCANCAYNWFVMLLIYRPAGSKNLVPYDWAPYYAGDTNTPVFAETPHQSTGTASESSDPHSGDPCQ